MLTSTVRPARSVAPAATASKSTKASAKQPAAAKAKTSDSPSVVKGLPRRARKPALLPKSHSTNTKDVRSLDGCVSDQFDEKQLAAWIEKAASVSGWAGGSRRRGGSPL